MTRPRLHSSSPLAPGVTFVVTDRDDSLECRITGRSLQPGATARAHWDNGRAVLEESDGTGAKDEQRAAGGCARRLCKATQRAVVCSV